MKKWILMIAAVCGLVAAGVAQNYGTVIMVNGASTVALTAVEGVTATVTSGGVYTNAIAYTNYYRLGGTNYSGRLPTGSNVVAIWTGSASSNAVLLSWIRKYGVLVHVIERSQDGGVTWTNWTTVGASVTNWTDTGSNTWQTTDYSAFPVIGTPSYPWDGGASSGAVAAAMATALVAQATADQALGTGSTALASISLHMTDTNPHAITPGMIGAATSNQGALAETAVQVEVDPASVHVDGSSSMNGHLVMNAYKGVITGTNSLILPLSANADAEYSQGGGHIALLSKSLGGAVQIVAYDPTGAVRRIEFYVGSNMNETAATIEIDGFHGNGSGITGLTAEQFGAVAISACPTTTAHQITWADDTNTIVVTDAGGSDPNSHGTYAWDSVGLDTNAFGWFTVIAVPAICHPTLAECYVGGTIPGTWSGSDGATGSVHVAYAQHLVTNSVTWGGIVTNIVGVSTQIVQYGSFGNITNVIRLP